MFSPGCRGQGNTLNLTLLGVLGVLAVGSSFLNRHDAKDAKESEETTNQTEIPLAGSSVKATTLQKFRVCSCISWLKNLKLRV
jgi:hypothetical protein